MNVTLIGMGSGQPENLTLQGLAALRQADLILGARRLLAVLPAGCTENRAAAYRPDEVAELLQTSGAENAVLVYSGDTGFYSGAPSMMEKLEALGVRAEGLQLFHHGGRAGVKAGGPRRPRPGVARPFQHPATGGGAGPSVAGVEPCFGPWPHL